MVLTGIKPMSYAPTGTPCVFHNLSISISMAMMNMCQPISCGVWHKLPGLDKPPRILTMLHCLTVAISMRLQSLSVGLSFLQL